MTIGYLSDLPAIRRSKAVQMRPNLSDNASRRYVLSGDPAPWGFQQDKYFVAYWKEA